MYNTIHQIKLQPVNDAAYIGIAIPMLFVTVILPMLLIFQSAYSQNKKSKQYIPSDLGERMKYYEAKSSNISVVEPEKAFVIRIDGRAFSKYTKAIKNLSLSNCK